MPSSDNKEEIFLNLLSQGIFFTAARKVAGIGYSRAKKIAESQKIHITKHPPRLTLKEIQSRIPDESQYMSYKNGKYQFLCTRTHRVFSKTADKIYQGSPFGKSGKVLDEKEFSERIKIAGYDLVEGSFSGMKAPCAVICPKGHRRSLLRAELAFKNNCPECGNNGISKAEVEIKDFITNLGFECIKLKIDKDGIGRKSEFDIFVPSKNIAVEYCGLYWHCENSPQPRPRSYHANKLKIAQKMGIDLLMIFEDEYKTRKSQVFSVLKSKLGVNEKRIYGRNCEVSALDKKIASTFFTTFHLQGPARQSIVWLGLFYDNELIGVISGGRHHRKNESSELVLDRLCFKSDVTVIGGAGKLFSSLCDWAQKANFKSILSWSDNRWSSGAVYKALGFECIRHLPPDYSYVRGGRRFSKQSLKKTSIEKNSGKTEWELRKAQGYDIIWDCGKKVWFRKIL